MRNCWLLLLPALTMLASSCSGSSDAVVESNDYCYIKSVTLGTVKRKLDIRDRQGGLIRTTNSTFTGSSYAMTIDHRNGIIENRDSLPFGSQLDAVLATITFDGSVLTYRQKGSEAWTAYNATDSLDLTRPLELLLTSNDNQSSRTYTFKVNVHQQEGDSLYWELQQDEVEPLADLTDMKAFFLDDQLIVIGKSRDERLFSLFFRRGLGRGPSPSPTGEGWGEAFPLTGVEGSEADVQSLRQHDGMLYLSTSDGRILSSSDATNWQQVGSAYPGPLTLVEKTDDFFYAISEGKMLRSTDASTWEEDQLDSDPLLLPAADIRALTLQQANGNSRIVMVGKSESSLGAVVWNKMWNESEKEDKAMWVFFPWSQDNTIPCPKLEHFNLLAYDGKCIAFGGASADQSHKALDALYISQDYGITWRPSTELHLPFELEGTEGCVASAVDEDNFIWIITNAQVWRGRLNRLGFAQQ